MEDQNNLLSAKRDHHKELDQQRYHAMTADDLRKTLDKTAFVWN